MGRLKLAVIGFGKAGSAIVKGLLRCKGAEKFEVRVSTKHPEKHAEEVKALGVYLTGDNREVARWADVVLIAVKPLQVKSVLEEIREEVRGKLVISIAAAISLALLEKFAPGARFIRAMPNLAAEVCEAVTAFSLGSTATDEDRRVAYELFGAIGDAIEVEEDMMDMITGVSGSGPAYAFVLIDALADAGVKAGLPKDLSLRLVARTMLGAAKLLLESGKHPYELKDMVVTPGGVTIMAMYEIERSGIRGILMEAVEAAIERAKEIAERLNKES